MTGIRFLSLLDGHDGHDLAALVPPLASDRARPTALVFDRPSRMEISAIPVRPFDGTIRNLWFGSDQDMCSCLGLAELPSVLGWKRGKHFMLRENVVIGDPDRHVIEGSVKLMAFIRRREGINHHQFQDHWNGRHAELVLQLPHVQRYVQSSLHDLHYEVGRDPEFDGLAELWWPSRELLEDAWSSPQMAEDSADMALFTGPGRYFFVTDSSRGEL